MDIQPEHLPPNEVYSSSKRHAHTPTEPLGVLFGLDIFRMNASPGLNALIGFVLLRWVHRSDWTK
jgi:hypothetical protein